MVVIFLFYRGSRLATRYGAYITSKDHKLVKELESSFEEISGQKPDLSIFTVWRDFNYFVEKNRANLSVVITDV